MKVFEIPGIPLPLQRHRHCGKKCYDPQKKEKETIQWYIKSQMNGVFPANTAIKLVVEYHMPIPRSYSLKKAKKCLQGPHTKKPDLSNLIKFTEDALNGIVWEDDSFISEIESRKFYSEEPKTVFKIEGIAQKIWPLTKKM